MDQAAVAADPRHGHITSGEEARAFLNQHAAAVPTAIRVVEGDLAITIGPHTFRASAQDLAAAVTTGGVVGQTVE